MRRGSIARETRQTKADALRVQRNKRSISEQLALLKSRPGFSIIERERLVKKLKEQKKK